MPILTDNNKVTPELQSELATYGLVREKAIEGAAKTPGSGPKFFGIREDADEFKLYFTNDLRKLDQQDDPMQLGIVAPDNEPFDMLASKDMSGNMERNEMTLRRYLMNLLDAL